MKKLPIMRIVEIAFVVICVLVIGLGIFTNFKIKQIFGPQDDYAKYLVDLNNRYVRSMYDFLVDIEKVRSMEEGSEKQDLLKVTNQYILDQDDLAKELRDNYPILDNADFYSVANQMNQTYLFMIQGEIGILEQMYLEEEDRDTSILKMNYAMQNVMGEIILQFPNLINDVRGTNNKPNYTYIPDDNSIEVTGIKSDAEYSQYLDELNEEYRKMTGENDESPIKNVEIEEAEVPENE